ncbi:hypothetical protein LTR56_018631 [Elasticomyces elasticus]|nr:hypothetical protein LTR56_018631 [Elasticomyces elasticus]KAK3635642.1 hypothetical protein LTR22_019069 [Elasticomyces elasticus]KAK4933086.1 hypothetical protein LTR49_000570 [Elasticomyces elasticus]KAK5763985.1 hypothetical protein LTS12_005895 [Elasticomyces elasticus]
MRRAFNAIFWLSTASAAVTRRQYGHSAPTAVTKNGTYVGRYEPAYDTDYFLGMPYAQPPVGPLRFHTPVPLNNSWSGTRNATEYGPECFGYGLDTVSQGNYVSEDCLTINVVRPKNRGDKLPVLLWIHGGGLVMGGSADNRYNQSFIVQQSCETGMPILAVSINYRLSSWGFLYGQAIQDAGQTMNGFRDQRLALQWIQENIAAFGGDPTKVTIQGESSGGTSVGAQLLAYNGRDDKLFSGAIAESGAPVGLSPSPTIQTWEPIIANLSAAVGCSSSADVLSCFRSVPTDQMNAAINSSVTRGAQYGPVVDGDFIVDQAVTQLERGDFVHVPYIIGANSDEGTGFGPRQVNTTEQFLSWMTSQGIDNATAQDMAILYPDIPEIGIPASFPGRPNGTFGLQFKRSSAAAGDEVAFVFYNTMGLGYPQNGNPNPLGGVFREDYLRVSKLMTRMWISFVNYGDPNQHLGVDAQSWPVYTLNDPQNFVFEQNVTSHPEADLYRAEGIHYIENFILARAGGTCSGLVTCGASDVD